MLAAPAGEALGRRLAEPLPAISPGRPEVPAWVDAIITKATARSPAERFGTTRELRRALAAGGAAEEQGFPGVSSAPPREDAAVGG